MTIKPHIPIIIIAAVLASCSSGKLLYDFEMQYPVKSKELFFENDSMSITFNIVPEVIGFTIFNKMNDGMKISWDEVSLSINGQAYRVVHRETGVFKTTDVQPPTTIPPKSSLKDGILRPEMLAYTSSPMATKTLTIKPTFPVYYYNKKEKTKLLALKGTKIIVFLPYYVAGKYVSMYYDIYIRDVKAIK